MSVPAGAASTIYQLFGDNLGPFPTPFTFEQPSDVVVWLDQGTEGGAYALAQGVDYTLTAPNPTQSGGSILLGEDVLQPGPQWFAGARLAICRQTADGQPSSFGNAVGFQPATWEAAVDHLERQIQDLRAAQAQAVTYRPDEVPAALPARNFRRGLLASWSLQGDASLTAIEASQIAKGDPGGNAMAVGLFTALPTLTIPGGTDLIQTSGYSAVGVGAARYAVSANQAGPATAIHQQSLNGVWFDLAELAPTIEMVGALRYPNDDTGALQTAMNLGGAWLCGPYVYQYTQLAAPQPLRLIGAGSTSATGGTELRCLAGLANAAMIAVGGQAEQLDGVWFENLMLTAPNAVGGAVLSMAFTADSGVRNCQFLNLGATQHGILLNQVNTISLELVRIVNPTASGVRVYGGDATRSDVIRLTGVIVSGDSLGAATHLPNAVDLDGFVNTIQMHACSFVECGRGIWRRNAAGTTQRAEYLFGHDVETDYPYYEALRVDWGDGIYFTSSYFHGSVTTHNIVVNTQAGATITNLEFKGGNCTGAAKNGMLLNGNYTRVRDMIVTDNSLSANGTYPGIEIGANSIGVSVRGCTVGEESGYAGATQSYGVQVDAGATEYEVEGNDLTGNVTYGLNDLSGAYANSSGRLGFNLGCGAAPDTLAVLVPVAAQTITVGPAGGQYNVEALELLPAGVLATLTIALPAQPRPNQGLSVYSSQALTALTVTPAAGQTLDVDPTSLAAGAGFALRFIQTIGQPPGTGRWAARYA